MNEMNITAAQYLTNVDGDNDTIRATIDGTEMNVPVSPGNRHYDEIMKQVEAKTLTIQDAD
tara:strand:- start:6 stop:188 length:183 start_codon:yes stop_codon:yes gene_type:complete